MIDLEGLKAKYLKGEVSPGLTDEEEKELERLLTIKLERIVVLQGAGKEAFGASPNFTIDMVIALTALNADLNSRIFGFPLAAQREGTTRGYNILASMGVKLKCEEGRKAGTQLTVQ